jgi:hypothetical protein
MLQGISQKTLLYQAGLSGSGGTGISFLIYERCHYDFIVLVGSGAVVFRGCGENTAIKRGKRWTMIPLGFSDADSSPRSNCLLAPMPEMSAFLVLML